MFIDPVRGYVPVQGVNEERVPGPHNRGVSVHQDLTADAQFADMGIDVPTCAPSATSSVMISGAGG